MRYNVDSIVFSLYFTCVSGPGHFLLTSLGECLFVESETVFAIEFMSNIDLLSMYFLMPRRDLYVVIITGS